MTFNWPLAPYAVLVEPDAVHLGCTVVLRNKEQKQGLLMSFDPDNGEVVLAPSRANGASRIELSDIKAVQLDQPVSLMGSTVMTEDQGVANLPIVLACTVEFHDGDVLKSSTFGVQKSASGIFLYLATKEKRYLRQFIPFRAIKKYSLGDAPLGQMLVEEKVVSESHLEQGLQRQAELRERRLGEYLAAAEIISADQLVRALDDLRHHPVHRLGDALLDVGLITREQLDNALKTQAKDRNRQLGGILVEMGVVDESTINRLLARKLGIPFINLSRFAIDPKVVELVPKSVVTKYSLMPLGVVDQRIFVAMENPLIHDALAEVRYHAKRSAEPVMASGKDIAQAINAFYEGKQMKELTSELAEHAADLVEESEHEPSESDNTLTRLVNKVVLDAHQQGASDVHIETHPGRQNVVIRFRKDGVMTQYLSVPPNYRNAIVSRIKIMAHLDIAEKRKGQDGKIDFSHYGPAHIELRVATIPTTNGLEDVVLRLLASGKPIPLDKIGLSPGNLFHVKEISERPHGIFFVCGPTGSGKTTTLHSVLSHINNAERKIWTTEDPIEITQEGLRQVQVNPKIGWTFANVLRSFLRADPDVIMVGEMRDGETARIGIEAALTGHMVLSTLHTNSAPESVVRLLDLGADSFNCADAMLGVLAQRLVRRLCPECKRPHAATGEEIDALVAEYGEAYVQAHCTPPDRAAILADWHKRFADDRGKITLYTAVGCPSCDKTGYKGRLGIHELLVATPAIKKMIQVRAPVSEILAGALNGGMHTLKQDGIEKVLAGYTDITKVRAAC